MDADHQVAGRETEGAGRFRVVDLGDFLKLEIVVARA